MNYDDEKFKLTKLNIILIVIAVLLLILLIVFSVWYNKLINSDESKLPDLNVTSGRVTTESTSTSEYTTTTTTTTEVRHESPYYIVDFDNILNDNIYTKDTLSREEALEVGKNYIHLINSLYELNDNSLFNIKNVLDNAKSGESDVYTNNKNVRYGELYDFDKFLNKFTTTSYKSIILDTKYDKTDVFVKVKDIYYRIENTFNLATPVEADISVSSITQSSYSIKFTYYASNYKELGQTSPVYYSSTMSISYEDGRWKINSYFYPYGGQKI